MNSLEGLEASLATQIKVELVERGMDQKTLAEKINIHPVTLTKYMKGQRSIPMPVYFDIAAALGVTPKALMERAEARLAR